MQCEPEGLYFISVHTAFYAAYLVTSVDPVGRCISMQSHAANLDTALRKNCCYSIPAASQFIDTQLTGHHSAPSFPSSFPPLPLAPSRKPTRTCRGGTYTGRQQGRQQGSNYTVTGALPLVFCSSFSACAAQAETQLVYPARCTDLFLLCPCRCASILCSNSALYKGCSMRYVIYLLCCSITHSCIPQIRCKCCVHVTLISCTHMSPQHQRLLEE